MSPNDADEMANSVDPDQDCWSGSALFAQAYLSENLGSLRYEGSRSSLLEMQDLIKMKFKFELPHDKTNKMACVPSEDLGQPGHPPSLIRVFTVRAVGS